jgi:3-oxoacyl-[acyl-carrier-protein] synthase III
MRAKITGTGSFLPKKVVTNDDLAKTLDTSDEWIASRTGIRQRYRADFTGSESCSAMGINAAKRALEMANLRASDLDLIMTATVTADLRLPTAACMIQEALGAANVPAFDLSAACAGSIYGLSIAQSFIRNGSYKNILLVTSEAMSSIVDQKDRNTAVLFGDAASAAIISASPDDQASGFIDFDLYADGRMKEAIWIPEGGSYAPVDKSSNCARDKVEMNGRETYKFAVRAMCDAVEKIAKDNQISIEDFKHVVPHQANLRIIEAIAERLHIPMDRFLINLDRCANTSAASLLLVYDEANRKHQFKPNDLILMLAIGAGFVWGAAIYRV